MLKEGIPVRLYLLLLVLFIFIVPVLIAGVLVSGRIMEEVDSSAEKNLINQLNLISRAVEVLENEYKNQETLLEELLYLQKDRAEQLSIMKSTGESLLNDQAYPDQEEWERIRRTVIDSGSDTNTIFSYPDRKIIGTYYAPRDWVIGMMLYKEDYRRSLNGIIVLILLVVLALLLLSAGMILLVARTFSSPFRSLEREMKCLADGDLTRKMKVRTTIREIKQMTEAFEKTLLDGIRGMLQRVKEMVRYTRDTSEEISTQVEGTLVFSNQMSEGLARMKNSIRALDDRIQEVSTAAEEIQTTIGSLNGQIRNQASSVTQTSAAIEEMNSSIHSVAHIADERQKAAQKLIEITSTGGEQVIKSNELTQEIGSSINDMMDMITVINKVAAQTNLLAMNAAIEAAHAGDAGRGFAVVAEEIRKLSTSTAESAKKISVRLKEIIEQIQKAADISDDTGRAFREVHTEVNSFVNAFHEIASSTSELSGGSREMLEVVNQLNNITHEIQTGSEEMTAGISEISETAVTLREYSKESVESLMDLSEKNQNVNFAQGNMTDMVIKNNQNSTKLSEEIGRFRLAEDEESADETSGEFMNFTIGALVIQEWIVRLRGWMDNESRPGKLPSLEDTVLQEWIDTAAAEKYAGNGKFVMFLEGYASLKEESGKISAALQEKDREKAEEEYIHLTNALKKAKSALHSLRYELAEDGTGV